MHESMMKRWFGSAIVAVVTAAGACGGSDLSEVQTNSGGILDCPSDTVLYATWDPVLGPGSSLPGEALSVLAADRMPLGTPQMESESTREVVYVYTDADGHRLGRVMVGRPYDTGWFATRTERCG